MTVSPGLDRRFPGGAADDAHPSAQCARGRSRTTACRGAPPCAPAADPGQLRAEARRLLQESAVLQARADVLGRRALELEAEAREIEASQRVVPFRKRWGELVIVDALPFGGIER